MTETRTAKLFNKGAGQAVRLPTEFRFEDAKVFISRDEATGDVRLSARHPNWSEFFELVHSLDLPDDFMSERPMNAPISKCSQEVANSRPHLKHASEGDGPEPGRTHI